MGLARPSVRFPIDPMFRKTRGSSRTGVQSRKPAPVVVFIHGPPASGKLTIAKDVCALSGLALFHNHLVVDLLLALFPFGSTGFVKHREALWLDLMGAAVESGTSLVFTFTPERSVKPGFPGRLRRRVALAGGRVRFVRVRCAEKQIEARMTAGSRRTHGKLVSLDLYRELKRNGAFEYPPIDSDLEIDSTAVRPRESATKIVDALSLCRDVSITGKTP